MRGRMGGLTTGAIVDLLGATFSGDPALRIDRVRTLAEAGPNDLSFLGNPKYAAQVDASRAGAILVAAKQPGFSVSSFTAEDIDAAIRDLIGEESAENLRCLDGEYYLSALKFPKSVRKLLAQEKRVVTEDNLVAIP